MMKRLEDIIRDAVRDGLSDIYITGGHPMVSRRFGGSIRLHEAVRWAHRELDELLLEFLTPDQLDHFRQRKSVDFAVSISRFRLRVNAFITSRGISLAIRVLPGHIPTIEELNLHPSLHGIAELPSGLVLTCGSTGVGKSTTVAAIIAAIGDKRATHIITLENPIEYRFQSRKSFIQQRELGPHMPSFAQGLLDALRENPDVIVVGELREKETMRIALSAAESGHLVIATMHASSPEEAIYRMYSAFPSDAQEEVRHRIASTLQWLIIQQLVSMDAFQIRVPLLTIVRNTRAIKNIIRENKLNQLEGAIQIGKNEGMFTADQYRNDYLTTLRTFAMPSRTFRPSTETSDESDYESPLLKHDPVGSAASLWTKPSPSATGRSFKPEVIRSPHDHDETENLLTIDEDSSLQDLIRKLEK